MPVDQCFNRDAKYDLHRNVADFQPSIWGNYFLQYASESMELDQKIETQIETLKYDVRKMLVAKSEKPFQKVHLIDSICRLGVSYYFEKEIEENLQYIHRNSVENGEIIFEDNLYSLAVLFRLLRQQGLYVSPNVFNKYKDDKGSFSETLIKDVEGMLSLYEATHLMIHGEDILEEALAFTTTHLESIANQSSHPHATQVKYSLRQTIHKNLPRLEARRFISIYEQDPLHIENLLLLAKLDFNMLQTLHQKEFGIVCKWNCLDNLPAYMKFLYGIILDLYEELEHEMKMRGKVFALNYHVKELKKYVQAYMTEARWLNNNYKPTLEEYIRLSIESSGYVFMVTTCFMGMGEIVTEDILKWVANEPTIVNASIVIGRLMDDIVSNEFEQKRDHISSFLECYMKKYNVSRDVAIQEGRKRIVGAWKDMNKECLIPTQVPVPFLKRILNLSRFMDVVYKDKDNFTHPEGEMKTFIKLLLVDPVPI
ncbi:probable terpene synthase 2 isoform X1 [Vicia villosa]|uniref:probable terpene synthase 2 isoform X1 n=1 Tax=Vicia villosa TaxID=3911 RepID=UPI00273CC86B|nr:probable terpene synthase 2 isoform X1 [Vicia villosa]